MDWSVGTIICAVEKLDLRDHTFVYFTSDNCPHLEEINSGEYHGGWKGINKGGKINKSDPEFIQFNCHPYQYYPIISSCIIISSSQKFSKFSLPFVIRHTLFCSGLVVSGV